MNSPKQAIGSDGFTDALADRLDRVARLLATQQTKARSKRLLISLFQSFFRVYKERAGYQEQVHNQTATVAWADGYLHAIADAINFYLEKRFSVKALTFEECELLVERPSVTSLFSYEPTATTGREPEPGDRAIAEEIQEDGLGRGE